ncbi:MAG: hypothetical protein ABFD66_02085 [Smithella sp.]
MGKMSLADLLGMQDQEQKDVVCIMGDDLAKYRAEHQPIDDLKPGDTLMLKDSGRYRFPKVGQIVEVYSIIQNPNLRLKAYPDGGNHDCDNDDFTVVMKSGDSSISEYAFDSRYFDRV